MTTPTSTRRPVIPPGHGRLGVVVVYFRIFTGLAALFAGASTVAALFPQLGWRTSPANPLIAAALAAVMAFGFHRTAQALDQRRRFGAVVGLITFGAGLIPGLEGSGFSLLSAGISIVGIAALVSVWRHLR